MAVLITCALGPDAYRLKRNLSADKILLGDSGNIPQMMVSTGQMIQLPKPAGSSYQHEMLALCLDHQVSTLYPLDSDEAAALAESEQLFLEYGIKIIYNT